MCRQRPATGADHWSKKGKSRIRATAGKPSIPHYSQWFMDQSESTCSPNALYQRHIFWMHRIGLRVPSAWDDWVHNFTQLRKLEPRVHRKPDCGLLRPTCPPFSIRQHARTTLINCQHECIRPGPGRAEPTPNFTFAGLIMARHGDILTAAPSGRKYWSECASWTELLDR